MKVCINTLAGLVLLLTTAISTVSAQAPTLVVTDEVQQVEFHDQITLVGRTSAWVESKIVSEVAGQVEAIDAIEGSQVSKNSPLITIKNDQIELELSAKTAEAEQMRLQAELARTMQERANQLFQQNLISETAHDSASALYGIQKARYEQLEADRKRLALDLANCTIKAPYTGYTGRLLVNVGEWVNLGQPVFEMVDLSKVKVYVDLPEKYFGHLKIGSKVDISYSNKDEHNVTGKVIGISPNASKETHTFPVVVEVNNADGLIGGGMLVKATLYLNDKFTSLAVSKDAIIRQGMQTMVYTIVEGKAAPIPVMTSSTDGNMIAVQSAQLKAGMPVVVRGNERIFPGAPVTTGNEPPPSDSQGQG